MGWLRSYCPIASTVTERCGVSGGSDDGDQRLVRRARAKRGAHHDTLLSATRTDVAGDGRLPEPAEQPETRATARATVQWDQSIKVDQSGYGEKLALLDCQDEELLGNVERLREARRALVHEKAHFEYNDAGELTGELMTAQGEAQNARAVMLAVEKRFGLAD